MSEDHLAEPFDPANALPGFDYSVADVARDLLPTVVPPETSTLSPGSNRLLSDSSTVIPAELPPPRREKLAKLDLYRYVDSLLSDEAINAELNEVYRELEQPEMRAQLELKRQIDQTTEDFWNESDIPKYKAIHDQLDALRATARKNPALHNYFESLFYKKERLEKQRVRHFDIESDEAVLLLSSVTQTANEQAVHAGQLAPFAKYKSNTKQAWNYVPEASVRAFLEDKKFMETGRKGDYAAGEIIIKPGDGKTIDMPVNIFIDAAGFDSWSGRKRSGKSYGSADFGYVDSGKSIDAMKHYASLPSELPAIEQAYVFVQPNGKIFASNGSGDSHRLGAALLRGDTSVKAESIIVIKAKYDYITDNQ